VLASVRLSREEAAAEKLFCLRFGGLLAAFASMKRTVITQGTFNGLLATALLLASCTSYRLTPDLPDTLALEKEIRGMENVEKKPGVPIIDIHTHFFNSRYLPIQGILAAREDELLTFPTKALALIGTGHWLQSKELREFGQLIQLGTSTDPVKRRHLLPDPKAVDRYARMKMEARRRYEPWLWLKSERSLLASAREDALRLRLGHAWWIKVPAKGSAAADSPEGKYAAVLEAAGLIATPTDAILKAMRLGNYRPLNFLRDQTEGRVEDIEPMMMDLTDGANGDASDQVDHKVITERGLDRLLRNVESLSHLIEHPDPASLSKMGQSYDHQRSTLESVYWFALHLMAGEPEMVRSYMQSENAQVDFFVHMMMNMAPSFRMDSEKEPHIYDFAGDQLARANAVDKAAGGHAMHFVAWNPFDSKDNFDWKKTNPKALQIIKKGLSTGAKGVKFYPPMGYRPAENGRLGFPKPPSASRTPLALEQWKNRYQAEGWTPDALDKLNDKLFAYCEDNDIPIFVHTHHGDMRADGGDDPNYGELAHPSFWTGVLDKHKKLRLCFGHSGGPEYWIGMTEKPFGKPLKDFTQWGAEVEKFCLKYPNVYCEVGIHAQVANPALGARFAARMLQLAKLKCADGRHCFADKIMYGSDWFMPILEPPKTYLESFIRIYRTQALSPLYDRFFSKNAMAYLKLPPGSVKVREKEKP
jgi:predicted TIM-barrel fold metal-dependent hydrolase